MTEDQSVSNAELVAALEQLLDAATANDGNLDPTQYFEFIALLGHERGIVNRYHHEGYSAYERTAQQPRATQPHRARTSYHAAILARLVMDLDGGGGERPSILPGQFKGDLVVHDLLTLVAAAIARDSPAMPPSGKPQLLKSHAGGPSDPRGTARQAIVLAVVYRRARHSLSVDDACGSFHKDLPTQQFKRWRREFVGRNGTDLVQMAEAKGVAGEDVPYWSAMNEVLAPVLDLALSGPGTIQTDED